MENFKFNEIRNLKRLRLLSIAFLVILDVLIIGFLTYMSYRVFESRAMKDSFIASVFPTLMGVQVVLAAAFSPLMFIIAKRLGSAVCEIQDLDFDFTMLYQNYATTVGRFFPEVPQYLISQKGLFVFKNFKTHFFPPDSIDRIEIRRINLGRFGKKCHIRFYENNQFKTKITYESMHPKEADFLVDHIRRINRNITIS